MKKLFIMTLICLLTLSLTACSQDFKDKKEFTIKDLINDENTHVFWVTHNDGTDIVLDQVTFTKNGQIKTIPTHQIIFKPKFFNTATPSEIENQIKKEFPKAYAKAKYHNPNYLVITNDDGSPLMTGVVDANKNYKKDNSISTFKQLTKLNNYEEHLAFSNMMFTTSQDPSSEPKCYAEYTRDPSVIGLSSDSDKDQPHMTTIINKGQKPVQFSKDTIKQDDDIIPIKRSDFVKYENE